MRSQICKQTTRLEREEKMKISKPVKYEENRFDGWHLLADLLDEQARHH